MSLFSTCLTVLPESCIIMLKRMARVDSLVLGLAFVLHLRLSLLQHYTADIVYSLLASLVMRGGGIHIFYYCNPVPLSG